MKYFNSIKYIKLNKMTTTEIVNKLIGPIDPLGDASRDPERLHNLKDMCKLVK